MPTPTVPLLAPAGHRYLAAKRATDLLLALAALPLLAAMGGLLWVVHACSDGESVFYRQERMGARGPFMMWKFRSMSCAAETRGPDWVVPRDPRITRLGRKLRRWGLDEIPQLLNILTGQMSFVGPRPVPLSLDRYFREKIPDWDLRYDARPGITSLAKLRSRACTPPGTSAPEYREAVHHYDIEYLTRRSWREDIRIILLTPLEVRRGHDLASA